MTDKEVENENEVVALDPFLVQHKDYERVKIPKTFKTTNMDCYLLKLPKDFELEKLCGDQINLNAKTTLKIDNEKYVMRPAKPLNPSKLMIASKKLRKVETANVLSLQKRLKSNSTFVENVGDTEPACPLPVQTHVRHPLFGIHYKKKIKYLNDVQNTTAELKSKSKKRKSNGEQSQEIDENRLMFEILGHKTKRKSDVNNSLEDCAPSTSSKRDKVNKSEKKSSKRVSSASLDSEKLPFKKNKLTNGHTEQFEQIFKEMNWKMNKSKIRVKEEN